MRTGEDIQERERRSQRYLTPLVLKVGSLNCVDSSWNSGEAGHEDQLITQEFCSSFPLRKKKKKHLWLRCTMMLYSLLLGRRAERKGLCHTQVPALTCLFALQSAKQIRLPLEKQASRTCQRWAAHLKALEDHPPV